MGIDLRLQHRSCASCNAACVVQTVRQLQPDVTLMDLVMPEMNGIEAIRQIMTRQPAARILRKLHLASRTQAALYALKEGLASLDDLI